jgi:5-enolpyruvylshikimate-3-phosphate synthase
LSSRSRPKLRDPLEDSLPSFGLQVESVREESSPEEEEMRRRMQRMRGPVRKLETRRVPAVLSLPTADVRLRGDLDLAGWCAVTGCLRRGTDAVLVDVTLPTARAGLFGCLRRMGADIEIIRKSESRVCHPVISGFATVGWWAVNSMPRTCLGLGTSLHFSPRPRSARRRKPSLSGLADLRVEHDDRLLALADGLRSFGVGVGLFPDGLVLRGEEQPGTEVADAKGCADVALALHALAGSCAGRTELDGAGTIPVAWPHLLRVLAPEDS